MFDQKVLRLVFLILFTLHFWIDAPSVVLADASVYKERPLAGISKRLQHSSDGIGKFYLDREIAQVMGHEGAGWLERPRRAGEEQPQKVITALDLKPTDVVADIGAGTGYFSFRIAPRLSQGKVFAVDIQPEMIETLNSLKTEKHLTNVEPILSSVTNPNLPENSVDVALMVDAYHEFEYPQEMMKAIVKSLKPGGKVAIVEYRGENRL